MITRKSIMLFIRVLLTIYYYLLMIHNYTIIFQCCLHLNVILLLFNFFPRYSKEEPFSVISVDIRNHSNLTDSLEQYVKGEILEGADAYHCDKCNKKVTK